ncbi:hypothetical protein GJAV_G00066330 [Gymnothorax javanicus]|nr:hypothetical protein GJAV_G00066330 [Gymnothorax javanicus]
MLYVLCQPLRPCSVWEAFVPCLHSLCIITEETNKFGFSRACWDRCSICYYWIYCMSTLLVMLFCKDCNTSISIVWYEPVGEVLCLWCCLKWVSENKS